jgi:hypothetical protein
MHEPQDIESAVDLTCDEIRRVRLELGAVKALP